MKMEFSAGGLVYKKDNNDIQFALVLNHDQKWTFPKGHIEKGEKPEVTAAREVSEEIGATNLKVEMLLEKIDYWFVQDGEKIHKFVYFYLMQAPPDTRLAPQLEEIGAAQWFPPNETAKVMHYKEDANLLKQAFSRLKIKNGV